MDISLADAFAAYAAALEKGVSELSAVEKQQALFNHLIIVIPPGAPLCGADVVYELARHQPEPGVYERMGELYDQTR